MADFNIRSDSVDVEQIMKQIRARIPRSAAWTTPRTRSGSSQRCGSRSSSIPRTCAPICSSSSGAAVRRFQDSFAAPPAVDPPYVFDDTTLFASHRGGSSLHPPAAPTDSEAVLQSEHAEPGPARPGAVQHRHDEARSAAEDRDADRSRDRVEHALLRGAPQSRARDDAQRHRAEEPADARECAGEPARFQRAPRPRARRRRAVPARGAACASTIGRADGPPGSR